MRDYTGVPVHAVKDSTERVNIIAPIDYFLRDLSRAMRRINNGQVPDGSGAPIGDQVLSDIYLVLKGRVGNQVAHGGTLPGGTLTLSSTNNPTKGKVYLGEAQTSVYDEVNDRIGMNQTVPLAKVHIKVPDPAGVTATPTSDSGTNIEWSLVGGAASIHAALADTDDSTYARWTPNNVGTGISGNFTTGLANPGGTSGYTVRVHCRSNNTGIHTRMNVVIANTVGGSISTRYFIGGPSTTDATFANATSSFTDIDLPLNSTEIAAMNFAAGQPFTWQFQFSGDADPTHSTGNWDVSKVSLILPPIGGGSAEPLQKWQSPSNANSLDYAVDGNTNKGLVFSGNRIAVSADAFAITETTPASGSILTSQDAIGTVQWSAASAVSSKVEQRWVANGYYRVDNDVDGAWIVPHAMTVAGVTAYRRAAGSGGTTSIDVLKNGTTILSSLASVGATGGASATGAGTVSVTGLAAGDRITVSANAVETGRPQDWVLMLEAF